MRKGNRVARKRNTGQRLAWSRWFADQLRDRQWSQADFARRSGINTGQVSTWASGQRLPSYESAARIVAGLQHAALGALAETMRQDRAESVQCRNRDDEETA